MKSQYRVVIIGGGVVGASVAYHLTKYGWGDVAILERSVLTAGSSWHAAGGIHALNADPNIAALQAYTIDLLSEVAEEADYDIGMHMHGGISFASAPERWEWLQATYRVYQTMGIEDCRLIEPDEIKEHCPIIDTNGVLGGLWADREGYIDCSAVVHAYAKAARQRGADVIEHNRVVELEPTSRRDMGRRDREGHDPRRARRQRRRTVGQAGSSHGRLGSAGVAARAPLPHHRVDPRTRRHGGRDPDDDRPRGASRTCARSCTVCSSASTRSTTATGRWTAHRGTTASSSLQPDIDRIENELAMAMSRYPALDRTGISRWVNGAFTFSPDGNPLVGPVPGIKNYWSACAVMAGFLQGGGVGKALAEWMIHGETEEDIYGMDVARFGKYAENRDYIREKTGQFYSRRFVMTYPNEQLWEARPLRTSPAYAEMTEAGANWGEMYGLEIPIYFADKGFEETPTLKRSNAFDIVGEECRTVRETCGILDITGFSRYEVTGPNATAWLDKMMASRLPGDGRIRLAPMLGHDGRMKGDLTVINWGDGSYWIMGSYYLRAWHMRWFNDHMDDGVFVRDLSDAMVGFSLSGPRSRDILASVTEDDVSNDALRFMGATTVDVGLIRAKVGRVSVTGELGYEIHCTSAEHGRLREILVNAGKEFGAIEYGFNAMGSLRMEKSFGIWSKEFRQEFTPAEVGMDRWIDWEKDFVGSDAARRERDEDSASRVLATLEIDTVDSDASDFEPVWANGERVGYITSGEYGHTVGKSLAMALMDREATAVGTDLSVHVVGVEYPARVIENSPYDPAGSAMRA